MAIKRLTIDGFGQVELNNVAFRRDGRIEAQCAPDTTAFSQIMVENGMLLAVDAAARKVTLATDSSLPIALNYSAEHLYDERHYGLKDFALHGDGREDFLPRLGYLAVGDKWTTNCIAYDSAEFANDSAFISALEAIASTPLFATCGSEGYPVVSSTIPTDNPTPIVLRVIEKTTMPDGQLGVKFQVYAC